MKPLFSNTPIVRSTTPVPRSSRVTRRGHAVVRPHARAGLVQVEEVRPMRYAVEDLRPTWVPRASDEPVVIPDIRA